MVYGASKDFDANGFRLGVFVSQHNPQIMAAYGAVSILYAEFQDQRATSSHYRTLPFTA